MWTESSARLPKGTQLALKTAALQAWIGKAADHAATSRRMLAVAAGTDDASTVEHSAKACCLRPVFDAQLIESAVTLAWRAVDLGQGHPYLPWYQMALGMAEYRCGDFAAADLALSAVQAMAKHERLVQGPARFFSAMSLFRQGRQKEARQLFAEAEARMAPLPADENQPLANGADADSIIAWLACKETRALLQSNASTVPAKP